VVQPALHTKEAVRLSCKDGRLVSLLADRAMPTDLKVRGCNHLLGCAASSGSRTAGGGV
jgi:hypothetical protein